jgi:hypothetical protein
MKKSMAWICGVVALVSVAYAADEITINLLLDVQNGNFALRRQVSNYKVTQSGTAADYGIQSVPINVTNVLAVSHVSTPGYVFLRNLSTANDIYVTCIIKLGTNDVALVPVSTTNMTAYCTAGTNNLEYWINAK